MNPFLRVIRYFLIGFFLASVFCFFALVWFLPLKLSFIISGILGFIYGLFCIGFMVRTLRVVEFEITTQNKNPERGFLWYREELEDQLLHMPYSKEIVGDKLIYKPRRLYQIYESPVEITFEPYFINIKASRMMMRILLDVIELNNSEKV